MNKIISYLVFIISINFTFAQLQRLDSIEFNDKKAVFLYDNNQNSTTNYFERDITTNSWIPKISYSYNYDNNLLESSYYANSRKIYTYNINNQLISMVRSSFTNPNWTFNSSLTYSYDSNGNNNEIISIALNSGGEPYNNYTDFRTFNSFNNLILDERNPNETFNSRTEYIYDINQNLIEVKHMDYNGETLTSSSKIEFNFASNNNLIQRKIFTLDLNSNNWMNYQKKTYLYNNNYSELIIPNIELFYISNPGVFTHLMFSGFNHRIDSTNTFIWNNTTNQWTDEVIHNYYWSNNVLDVNNLEFSEVNFFPNPVLDTLHINLINEDDIISIEIFNILGQKKIKTRMKNNSILPLNKLTKGIYILSVNGKYKTKFIKK